MVNRVSIHKLSLTNRH